MTGLGKTKGTMRLKKLRETGSWYWCSDSWYWCSMCGAVVDICDDREEHWEQSKKTIAEENGAKQFLDSLCSMNKTCDKLDFINDTFNHLFIFGHFTAANKILELTDVENVDLDILIGFLINSGYAYDYMPYHNTFFEKVEKRTKEKGEWKSNLLTGLDKRNDITLGKILQGVKASEKLGMELRQTEIKNET